MNTALTQLGWGEVFFCLQKKQSALVIEEGTGFFSVDCRNDLCVTYTAAGTRTGE